MKLALLALTLCACASASPTAQPAPAKPSAEEAKQFVAAANVTLKRLYTESQTADWIKNTYITGDTERNAAAANDRLLAFTSEATRAATRFKDLPLDFDTARMLYLLRLSGPVIEDPVKRLELTTLAARLEGHYGAAKDKKGRDLEQLEKIIDKSRNHDELLDAWLGWHDTAREQRPRYLRFVELENEGARGAGFTNMGDMWRSNYDMPPVAVEQ